MIDYIALEFLKDYWVLAFIAVFISGFTIGSAIATGDEMNTSKKNGIE